MNRTDLTRTLEEAGCVLKHGGRHDWYRNPKGGVSQPVLRHREIKDFLARHILQETRDLVREFSKFSRNTNLSAFGALQIGCEVSERGSTPKTAGVGSPETRPINHIVR